MSATTACWKNLASRGPTSRPARSPAFCWRVTTEVNCPRDGTTCSFCSSIHIGSGLIGSTPAIQEYAAFLKKAFKSAIPYPERCSGLVCGVPLGRGDHAPLRAFSTISFTRQELARQVTYLRAEILILRSKLPARTRRAGGADAQARGQRPFTDAPRPTSSRTGEVPPNVTASRKWRHLPTARF